MARVLMSFAGGGRKFKRLYEQLKAAGIEYRGAGALSLGSKTQTYIVPEESVETCKTFGMRVCKEQWSWLKEK